MLINCGTCCSAPTGTLTIQARVCNASTVMGGAPVVVTSGGVTVATGTSDAVTGNISFALPAGFYSANIAADGSRYGAASSPGAFVNVGATTTITLTMTVTQSPLYLTMGGDTVTLTRSGTTWSGSFTKGGVPCFCTSGTTGNVTCSFSMGCTAWFYSFAAGSACNSPTCDSYVVCDGCTVPYPLTAGQTGAINNLATPFAYGSPYSRTAVAGTGTWSSVYPCTTFVFCPVSGTAPMTGSVSILE